MSSSNSHIPCEFMNGSCMHPSTRQYANQRFCDKHYNDTVRLYAKRTRAEAKARAQEAASARARAQKEAKARKKENANERSKWGGHSNKDSRRDRDKQSSAESFPEESLPKEDRELMRIVNEFLSTRIADPRERKLRGRKILLRIHPDKCRSHFIDAHALTQKVLDHMQ